MESTAALEEPTMTKIHQTKYEEEDEEDDQVGDLERKTSVRREKRTVSTDSSTLTVTTSGSLSSSSSSGDGTDSFCTEEPNGKELSVDQSNAVKAENSETPELPELDKDLGFHGEHNDEKNASVYFDGEQGSEVNGVVDAVLDTPGSLNDDKLNGEKNHSNTENGSTTKDNEQSCEIEEVGVRDPPEDLKAVHQLNADVIEEELDVEGDDYDVEKVLENQETHDLYCPYCNSCITKRVILKKRKRKIRHVLGDPKREKLDVPVGEPTGLSPGDHSQSTDHGPQATDPEEESKEGPYLFLFRCLSCFGIFCPQEKIPGNSTEIETPLIPQTTTTAKPSWFFPKFGFNGKETAGGKGGVQATAPQVNPQGDLDSSPETTTGLTTKDPPEAQESVQGGATTSIPGGATNIASQVNPRYSDKNGIPNVDDPSKTDVPVQHVNTPSTQDHKPVDTESQDSNKPVVNERDPTGDGLGFLDSLTGKDNNLSNGKKPSGKVSLSPIQQYDNVKVPEKVTIGQVEVKINPELPMTGVSIPNGSSTTKPGSAPINVTGENIEILSDPGHVETQLPENPVDDLTASLLGGMNGTQPHDRVGEERKVEILKSIVYGGLIESITSLGVISSAAGSGATTLNILVLGLANLVGGLIVIVHNLQELREENPRRTTTDGSQMNEQEEDRYKRLLGRRENFRVHATLAILSFIIMGLIPPVVYGFSFQKSGNRDYKALSVLAASLVCIILLAIAKAHVKTPRDSYLKSVLYYTTIAISASGVSYFVGDILNQLLEKYGWSDGSENPVEMMLPLLGRKGGFGYSSY